MAREKRKREDWYVRGKERLLGSMLKESNDENLRHGCSDLTRKADKELSRPLNYTWNETLRLDPRFRWPKPRVCLKETDTGRVVADRLD